MERRWFLKVLKPVIAVAIYSRKRGRRLYLLHLKQRRRLRLLLPITAIDPRGMGRLLLCKGIANGQKLLSKRSSRYTLL
jgi:hypothetical protein